MTSSVERSDRNSAGTQRQRETDRQTYRQAKTDNRKTRTKGGECHVLIYAPLGDQRSAQFLFPNSKYISFQKCIQLYIMNVSSLERRRWRQGWRRRRRRRQSQRSSLLALRQPRRAAVAAGVSPRGPGVGGGGASKDSCDVGSMAAAAAAAGAVRSLVRCPSGSAVNL